MDRRRRLLVTGAVLAAFGTRTAQAQAFPSKPITIVVPYAPGATDREARRLGDIASKFLGQPVVVENRDGAGGTIGAQYVASSKPDGYTLLYAAPAVITVAPLVGKPQYGYDDLMALARASITPHLLAARADAPFKTLPELVAYAKANPGKLAYASVGNGSSSHLNMELLKSVAGFDALHVPFNGSPPAVTATIQGETQMMFAVMQPLKPQIEAGKLRAIAVTTAKRFPLLPDLPAIAESGYPSVQSDAWNGIVVPAGTPKAVIDKLNAEINAVLKMPDVVQKMQAQGFDLVGGTPEAFGALLKSETERWAPVIKKVGLKVD